MGNCSSKKQERHVETAEVRVLDSAVRPDNATCVVVTCGRTMRNIIALADRSITTTFSALIQEVSKIDDGDLKVDAVAKQVNSRAKFSSAVIISSNFIYMQDSS